MEPVDNTVPYKLGQMDARISNMEATLNIVQSDVKILLAREAQQKGSKTTMAGMGAGGVGVGGLIVAALQFWAGERPPNPPAPQVQVAPPAAHDERVNPSTRF